MEKQLHLEIDFVVNVKLSRLPALTSLNSQQCKVTERLFAVGLVG